VNTLDRRWLRLALERGLYGAVVGEIYAWVSLPGDWPFLIVTAIGGFSIGFFTDLLDRLLFLTPLRRQQFWVVLVIRTISFLVVVTVCVLIALGIYWLTEHQMRPGEDMYSERLMQLLNRERFPTIILYCFLVLLLIQFMTIVIRMVGPNILINYLLGRYHQPKEEERIFMFTDLRSSTTIAERLGPLKWHRFLNDYFYDIGEPVRRCRGEIYQYVGDEVVISWTKKTGLKNLNCIHCFFSIWDRMEKRRKYYLDTYGYEPIFKSGYHIGKVIAGEIGDYTRDIVFHGDAINTASRIQMECNHFNRRLLLSNTLLFQLDFKAEYKSEYITQIQLRGKEEILELYSMDPL
jgi:adenylate cyclase